MSETKNRSYHLPTTWAQVEEVASKGMHFDARPLKLKGEIMWVLSSAAGYVYGERDDFTNMLIAATDRRKARYMHEMGGDGSRSSMDDITYVVYRKGRPIVAARRDGQILSNDAAASEDPHTAKAIARLVPVFERLRMTNPTSHLFTLEG